MKRLPWIGRASYYPQVNSTLGRGNHSLKPGSQWYRHHKVVNDLQKRKCFKKFEDTRNVLRGLNVNMNIPERFRWDAAAKLNELPKNSMRGRMRNRGLFTTRSRYVLSKFHLDRISFRNLAEAGLIPGVTKYYR